MLYMRTCRRAPTILAEVPPVFHPELQHGPNKFVAAAGIDVRLYDTGEFAGKGKVPAYWQIIQRRSPDEPLHLGVA